MKHGHYFKKVTHLDGIDVYRVLELFEVTDPCLQHAIKKLLCAGTRGSKDVEDVYELKRNQPEALYNTLPEHQKIK